MSKIVVLVGSMRKGGNTDLLAQAFTEGASKNNDVELVSVADYKVNPCIGCNSCFTRKDNSCFQNDDMSVIYEKLRTADIVVIASPVYFYGISAQMKTFIDRTYPIWQHLGKKEVYYIISAGLGEDIIERSLGDLDGFVEHLEEYKIAGKIYAANVMEAGLVKNQRVFQTAYDMGCSV